MADLDKGGTYQFRQKLYLGPSQGWIDAATAILRIVTAGITSVELGNSFITVAVNGTVTVQLPKFKNTNPALPGQMRDIPIVIADIGGFALANPITILPFAGETISSLSSATIASNYGALVLVPDPVNGGCTVTQ